MPPLLNRQTVKTFVAFTFGFETLDEFRYPSSLRQLSFRVVDEGYESQRIEQTQGLATSSTTA